MTISKGLLVSDLVARVLVDISDPNQRRWTSDQVVKFINEGIRELATEGAFWRVDYQVPTADQAYFATFAECRRIRKVSYNHVPIYAATAEWMDLNYGADWRSDSGTPVAYIPDEDGILLYPIPSGAGDALTFASPASPAITETAGGKIDGNGYCGAMNSTTVVHFKPGDGEVTTADTADNNLRIEYSYIPRPSESSDSIPARYADALVVYATWRCFNVSEVTDEAARAQVLVAEWQMMKNQIVTGSNPAAWAESSLFGAMECI